MTERGTKHAFFKAAMPPLGVFIDDKVENARGIPHDRFFLFHMRGRRGESQGGWGEARGRAEVTPEAQA